MPRIRPVTDMQRCAPILIDEVQTTGEPTYITRNGRESCVLVDAETYDNQVESLIRQQVLFEDGAKRVRGKVLADIVKKNFEDIEAGRYCTLEELDAYMQAKFAGLNPERPNHIGEAHEKATSE